ncbi:MAG TPA: uroporphyrinogen-III C-methyltransferase [Xanthomonadaceae bacterium]|jgi:uroporphyrin-3 C-methyltransferase|nr:uroporphyrinogen-III C-methyltransferase [Xanthomonadaceae bacterium]
MASNDPSAPAGIAPPRRARGRGLLWLALLVLIVVAGWKLYPWWQAHMLPAAPAAPSDDASIGNPNAAIAALRREQHELAQRMSDATSSQQVLRDEVLGVGERAALLEQSVARIASPRAQGEQALRLDEAELLLTIGQQQIELSSDVGSALHAYALADATLAGSSDPSALNLRQSLAQEVAAMRALPPDPRAALAGQIDAFESTLDSLPFSGGTPARPANATVLDRVVGSMVEVHRAQTQDLLDPASREAALTAVRLELTLARLALERRDASAFHAALTRIDRWLPRLYAPETVAHQRQLLADMQRAPLRIDLPVLGGTLTELRRLRQEQPEPSASPATQPAPALPAAAATPSPPVSARKP